MGEFKGLGYTDIEDRGGDREWEIEDRAGSYGLGDRVQGRELGIGRE